MWRLVDLYDPVRIRGTANGGPTRSVVCHPLSLVYISLYARVQRQRSSLAAILKYEKRKEFIKAPTCEGRVHDHPTRSKAWDSNQQGHKDPREDLVLEKRTEEEGIVIEEGGVDVRIGHLNSEYWVHAQELAELLSVTARCNGEDDSSFGL